MVLLGGNIAVAQMGDPNASIPTPQPVYTRPMFAAYGQSVEQSAICFISQAAQDKNISTKLGQRQADTGSSEHAGHFKKQIWC